LFKLKESWEVSAIESGLASYFPSSYTNDPKYLRIKTPGHGDWAAWDLSRKSVFPTTSFDQLSAMREGTETWGGAFWEMRSALGPGLADKMLVEAWKNFTVQDASQGVRKAFLKELLDSALVKESKARSDTIVRIFRSRNLE
jgi:hypothetical protein